MTATTWCISDLALLLKKRLFAIDKCSALRRSVDSLARLLRLNNPSKAGVIDGISGRDDGKYTQKNFVGTVLASTQLDSGHRQQAAKKDDGGRLHKQRNLKQVSIIYSFLS